MFLLALLLVYLLKTILKSVHIMNTMSLIPSYRQSLQINIVISTRIEKAKCTMILDDQGDPKIGDILGI